MSLSESARPVILIADDERLNRELVRTFLSNAGYDVIETASGEEALEKARAQQPAVALLDVRMHGMSGYDVARVLKSDPATSQIKVVILSAQNRPSDQADAADAGADLYLYKLLDWSEIMRRIGELVRNSQASR